jgi:hypothetical protein
MPHQVATMQLAILTTACENHELHREVQVLEIRRADETVVIATQKVPLMPVYLWLSLVDDLPSTTKPSFYYTSAHRISRGHSLWNKSRATVTCVHQVLSVQVVYSDEFMAQWLWNGFVKSPSHRSKRDNYCG